MTTRAYMTLIAAAAALGLAAGCAASAGSSGGTNGAGATSGAGATGGGQCVVDGQCPTGSICTTTGTCVSADVHAGGVAIEIDPPAGAAAALTEILGVTPVPGMVLSLPTQPPASVAATFMVSSNTPVPATANVVLTIPPAIGGRPDLTFDTAASTSMAGAAATLSVPTSALAQTGTIELIPLPPADQQSPPYTFTAAVAATMTLSIPTASATIDGTLLDSTGLPVAGFAARAYQSSNGAAISNASVTDANGGFKLIVPTMSASDAIVAELVPADPTSGAPSFTSNPVTFTAGASHLGTIMQPPFAKPVPYPFAVYGGQAAAPVVGALVSARATNLPAMAQGTNSYQQSGTVDSTGNVTLPLLPGTVPSPVSYEIAVAPPAGSPYATQCFPLSVTAAANSPLTLTLAARAVLTGTVTAADGSAVSGVAVAATAGAGPTASCSTTAAMSASTATDNTGKFSLPLDAGTYTLDYDPGPGAAVPRFTETGVVVTADAPHDVTLPAGNPLDGNVLDPTSTVPLATATVRLFEVLCTSDDDCFGASRTAPRLLGQVVSDANGHFHVVIPAAGN